MEMRSRMAGNGWEMGDPRNGGRMKIASERSPMIARELLVSVAGERHAEHTVVRKDKCVGLLRFVCSCGDDFSVLDIELHRLALRNVADVAS